MNMLPTKFSDLWKTVDRHFAQRGGSMHMAHVLQK